MENYKSADVTKTLKIARTKTIILKRRGINNS
jgi:hypothetical protein